MTSSNTSQKIKDQFKTPREKAWDSFRERIDDVCARTDDPVQRKADIKDYAHTPVKTEDKNGNPVDVPGLGQDLTDRDYEALIAKWELSKEVDVCGVKAGEAYETNDELFLWDGVVVANSGTLLVGGAKTGKSSLICSMLGAMNRGEKEHLGRALNYEKMPDVFIVGTDQNKKDWETLLLREGLAFKDENGHTRNLDCIAEMFTRGDKIHLDDRGINAIAQRCKAHPGCLVVLDSYTSLTTVLGFDEIKKQWCDAARSLAESLEPLGASWVVLHHTNQGNAGGTAETASRGHTDLPSQFTWNNVLMWTRTVPEGAIRTDHRLTVKPSGRAKAEPMVIELVDTDNGAKYITHGDYAYALRSERVRKAEMELFKNPNSADTQAYLHICSIHDLHGTEMSVKLLAQQFNESPKILRSRLNRLEDAGLLVQSGARDAEGGRGGRAAVLWVPAVSDQGQGVLDQRDTALNSVDNYIYNNKYNNKLYGAEEQSSQKPQKPQSDTNEQLDPKSSQKNQKAQNPQSSQSSQSSQSFQSSLRERAMIYELDKHGTPIPREGLMVQILRQGEWQNNRVLQGRVDFKDDLSAAMFMKPSLPIAKGLQWMRDVKPCDEAHTADEEAL